MDSIDKLTMELGKIGALYVRIERHKLMLNDEVDPYRIKALKEHIKACEAMMKEMFPVVLEKMESVENELGKKIFN